MDSRRHGDERWRERWQSRVGVGGKLHNWQRTGVDGVLWWWPYVWAQSIRIDE